VVFDGPARHPLVRLLHVLRGEYGHAWVRDLKRIAHGRGYGHAPAARHGGGLHAGLLEEGPEPAPLAVGRRDLVLLREAVLGITNYLKIEVEALLHLFPFVFAFGNNSK